MSALGNDVAIRVEGLSKRYRIGARQARYRTFRESLVDALSTPLRRARRLVGGNAAGAADLVEDFWALRDVSFEVRRAEVVGVIGRNGAGKSTLLKVLSRITEPTEGYVDLCGRVGSLLEVGTGFHPELTGRENVFLNGAILGMRRAEIERKFDEIVDFSGIERFLDTPVKHYSSGMYVRLAFAVAAHLEPEILVVDEVLSVGDAEFQKKCLDKMEDVGHQGRTVLFVSHNMAAITRMCERAILLEGGRIAMEGPADRVVAAYLRSGLQTVAAREWPDGESAPGKEVARLRAVRVRDEDGAVAERLDIRRPVVLEMEFRVHRSGAVLMPVFVLYNDQGVAVLETLDVDGEWRGRPRPAGVYRSRVTVPGNLLSEGRYFLKACCTTLRPPVTQFLEPNAASFDLVDSFEGDSARGDWAGSLEGAVRPLLQWSTRYDPDGARSAARAGTA